MTLLYLLLNQSSRSRTIDSGETIPARGYGSKFYTHDAIELMLPELRQKRICPCLITPCATLPSRRFRQRDAVSDLNVSRDVGEPFYEDDGKHKPSDLKASDRQREYYTTLTGKVLPPDASRIEASTAIEEILSARFEEEEQSSLSVKTPEPPAPTGLIHGIEVLSGRLFAVEHEKFKPGMAAGFGTVVCLSGCGEKHGCAEDLLVQWKTEEKVDEFKLQGVVRLCAAAVRGAGGKVAVLGSLDAIQVMGACVLREYLGCDADTALMLMKGSGAPGLVEPALIETVRSYRLS